VNLGNTMPPPTMHKRGLRPVSRSWLPRPFAFDDHFVRTRASNTRHRPIRAFDRESDEPLIENSRDAAGWGAIGCGGRLRERGRSNRMGEKAIRALVAMSTPPKVRPWPICFIEPRGEGAGLMKRLPKRKGKVAAQELSKMLPGTSHRRRG